MKGGLFRNKYRIQTTRLPGYDYGQPGKYFITICSKGRVCYFGDVVDGEMVLSDVGKIAHREWLKTAEIRQNVLLDEFIVMPNHLHGIVMICDDDTVDNVETHCNGVVPGVETHCNGVVPGVETHCNASLHQRTIHKKPATNQYTNTKPYQNKFGPQRNNLSSIIRGFKSTTTKQINIIYGQKYFSWQPRFYENIIRSDHALRNIRYYIQNNPAKWWRDRNNQEGLLI